MKKIISITLALIMLLALFGCASKSPAENSGSEISQTESAQSSEPVDLAQGKTVACCMGSVSHPVHRVIQYGFCTKAEELGMIPVISGLDQGSMDELISQWETDISSNNAVGALIWTGDDSCYEMMKELKQQGVYTVVPYFAHSFEYTEAFIDVCIWYKVGEYGAAQADTLVKLLTEKGITSGNIAVSHSGPGLVSNGANNAFRTRIRELGVEYNVLDTIFTGAEINEATRKATLRLEETENVVAAVGFDEVDASAWANAVDNTGKEIVIIGMGASDSTMALIENGRADAIAISPYCEAGTLSAEYLNRLILGEVFNTSEELWGPTLTVNMVYEGGEGPNNIQTWRDLYNTAQEYFK